MTIQKIIDGILADTDGQNGGNVGSIVLEDEILQIDSGMVHTKTREMYEYLTTQYELPLLKLIYTHYHSDHVFGAQAFGSISRIASTPMRKNCDEALATNWKHQELLNGYASTKDERPELWESLQTLSIKPPNITFSDEIRLGASEDVTLKLLGGHTSGSSVVIAHQQNCIFVGDLIFSGSFPYAGDPSCNPDLWIKDLHEIKKSDYDYIIPGHGPVCDTDYVETYEKAMSELRDNVKAALSSKLSVDEFMSKGMIPAAFTQGIDRWCVRSLDHWFKFYR
ncbi:MAG: MBL fold metallo-hydrolase [Candidatus Thorarchaeota archaeon]|nr:MBL fold metallo-hydrolase [Candidatus Thorarchaeota archaeon]